MLRQFMISCPQRSQSSRRFGNSSPDVWQVFLMDHVLMYLQVDQTDTVCAVDVENLCLM